MELESDLWLDQPDAHERIVDRLAEGELTTVEADLLHGFVDQGFLMVPLDLPDDLLASLDADVDRLWQERPPDLAIAGGLVPATAFRDYDGRGREPGYRIKDLHSHAGGALDLYLHPGLFRMIDLIYGEPGLAIQSLYFEWGSQQSLHRDPMFVVTDPASHLLASWIALEDISPESGPLVYVPGSHRLPYFEFEEGTVVCPGDVTPEQRGEFLQWLERSMEQHGLRPATLTCPAGSAFIWHGSLVHGGSPITDLNLRRKSFVVHYCTASHRQERTARMRVREGDRWRKKISTTTRRIERPGARGLANPHPEQA